MSGFVLCLEFVIELWGERDIGDTAKYFWRRIKSDVPGTGPRFKAVAGTGSASVLVFLVTTPATVLRLVKTPGKDGGGKDCERERRLPPLSTMEIAIGKQSRKRLYYEWGRCF